MRAIIVCHRRDYEAIDYEAIMAIKACGSGIHFSEIDPQRLFLQRVREAKNQW
jgi:hypothetical protein